MYSWQTILVLRVLKELQEKYGVEVSGWGAAAQSLREQLEGQPFPSLWRLTVFFPDRHYAQLVVTPDLHAGGLIVPLEPHLSELASRLSVPPEDQLPLVLPVVVGR